MSDPNLTPAPENLTPDEEPEEPIELNGKKYTRHHGTAARVDYTDEAGELIGQILVPTDWEPNLSKEEILERAHLAYHRQAEITKWIEAAPEYVTALATRLREEGIFEGLASDLIEAFQVIKITGKLTQEERASVTEEALSLKTAEATELLREETATIIRSTLLTGDIAISLQQDFVRDLLLDAYMQGVYAFEEKGGDLDQEDTFQTFWRERSGDFLTPAFLDTFANTQSLLAETITDAIKAEVEPGLTKAFDRWFKKRRRSQRRRGQRSSTPEYLQTFGQALLHSASRAIASADGWETPEGSPYPVKSINRGQTKADVALRPTALDSADLYPAPELQAFFANQMLDLKSNLSPLATYAFDAMTATYLDQTRNPSEAAYLRIDDLLGGRGLKRHKSGSGRRGGYSADRRREMLQALAQVGAAWLRVAETPAFEETTTGKSRRTKIRAVESRLFVITDRAGQLRLDGSMDVEEIAFRPGEIVARFLHGPGRQIALQAATLAHYDPYREAPEYLLGHYLYWQWRADSKNGNAPKEYRIETLLREASLELYTPKPSRTQERIEKALDRLQADKHIAGWQYREGDAGRLEEIAGSVGWAEKWLRLVVLIECPDAIRDHYAKIKRPQKAIAAPAKSDPLSQRLKNTRQRLGLSQMQAAEDAGISQKTYSRAEQGARVNDPNQRKLEAWLKSHTAAA